MATIEETNSRLVSPGQMASPAALDSSMQIRSPSQPTRHHGHSHSQSLSVSSLGSPTRGGRRKSMSGNLNAVLQGMTIVSPGGHTGSFSLANPHQKTPLHGYPSPPSSLPSEAAGLLNGTPSPATFSFPRRESLAPPAASSGLSSGQFINSTPTSTTKRNRRASEGNHALMDGSAKSELRCDKCGKGYKHGSCLTKHLWEHTPEWSITSKLLISKHQQVQLLEAASILVSMNPETPPTSSSNSADGNSAADSNAVSDGSSTGDSPPPAHMETSPLPTPTSIPLVRSTRARSSSKRLSRSFQPPTNFLVGSAPSHVLSTPTGITKPRPRGSSFISSGSAQAAAQAAVSAVSAANATPRTPSAFAPSEDESLAAAVGLLSCSFGTTPGRDGKLSGVLSPLSPRTDIMMKIEEQAVDDMAIDDDEEDEGWSRSGSRSKSEEDDGVFGKMEE